MENYSAVSKQILKIVTQAVTKKMYGSIEIYFESGKVTQVTQRIINKISKKDHPKKENVKIIKENKSDKVREQAEDQNTLLTT